MWVARGWKPCLDICISMWTVKDKGGSGGLLAAKPFLVGCASIYFSINTLCYDVGLLPPRRESQRWALFAGRLDGSVGGLGSVALQLGGELRWDEGCAPHGSRRHPGHGRKFTPPSLFSIYRLAKLMKMHARAEREAVEMITIITRLDQSSLGGLKKKKTHVNPGLTRISYLYAWLYLISGNFQWDTCVLFRLQHQMFFFKLDMPKVFFFPPFSSTLCDNEKTNSYS